MVIKDESYDPSLFQTADQLPLFEVDFEKSDPATEAEYHDMAALEAGVAAVALETRLHLERYGAALVAADLEDQRVLQSLLLSKESQSTSLSRPRRKRS